MEQADDGGKVEMIVVAQSGGEPVRLLEVVAVVAGVGIPDDRYATRQGHWSDPRWPDQQLTLVEAELAAELEIAPELLRRNLVTRGVDLSWLIGREFAIGTAVLRGVRPCDPCRYLESLTRPGLFARMRGRGGIRAEVVVHGTIRVGDPVRPVDLASRLG